MAAAEVDASLAKAYLDLLKSSVLNDLYIENDARLLYLFAQLECGEPVDPDAFRNVGRRMPELMQSVHQAREDGRPWWLMKIRDGSGERLVNLRNVCEFGHSMIGRKRLANIEQCLDAIRQDQVPGDLIEAGVWRGGATVFMRGYLKAYGMEERTVWVADSFEGLPKPSLAQDQGYDFSADQMPILAIGLDEVRALFGRYHLLDERVRFLKGWFRDTLRSAPIERLALMRLDGDLYESTMDALEGLYGRLQSGGFVIVDDYGDFEPCRQAVHAFRERHGIREEMVPIDWTGVYWRKR